MFLAGSCGVLFGDCERRSDGKSQARPTKIKGEKRQEEGKRQHDRGQGQTKEIDAMQ